MTPTMTANPQPANADTNQDATPHQIVAGLGQIHRVVAGHHQRDTERNDPAGAEAVGKTASDDSASPPEQIGDGHGAGKRFDANAQALGHRRQVETDDLGKPIVTATISPAARMVIQGGKARDPGLDMDLVSDWPIAIGLVGPAVGR